MMFAYSQGKEWICTMIQWRQDWTVKLASSERLPEEALRVVWGTQSIEQAGNKIIGGAGNDIINMKVECS